MQQIPEVFSYNFPVLRWPCPAESLSPTQEFSLELAGISTGLQLEVEDGSVVAGGAERSSPGRSSNSGNLTKDPTLRPVSITVYQYKLLCWRERWE